VGRHKQGFPPLASDFAGEVNFTSGGSMSNVNVGDRAPDFELDSTAGEKVRLADFKGKKNVLLAFYPLDFTAICTNENCAFSTDYSQFEGKDTAVLPISVDSIPTHKEFRAKHEMSHHLLSDFLRKTSADYGVLIPERNFTQRAYFLIDKDGVVRWKHVEAELGHSRSNQELLDEIGKLG
jgi:peroxiredoxin